MSRIEQLQSAKALAAQAGSFLGKDGGLSADPALVAVAAALALILDCVPDPEPLEDDQPAAESQADGHAEDAPA